MTSSTAANYPEKGCEDPAVNEGFWTDSGNRWITNYMRSKIAAETVVDTAECLVRMGIV